MTYTYCTVSTPGAETLLRVAQAKDVVIKDETITFSSDLDFPELLRIANNNNIDDDIILTISEKDECTKKKFVKLLEFLKYLKTKRKDAYAERKSIEKFLKHNVRPISTAIMSPSKGIIDLVEVIEHTPKSLHLKVKDLGSQFKTTYLMQYLQKVKLPKTTETLVLHIPTDVPFSFKLERALLAEGFVPRGKSPTYFVRLLHPTTTCEHFIHITKQNVKDFDLKLLLPSLSALCPFYLSSNYLSGALNIGSELYVLLNNKGMPCAVAEVVTKQIKKTVIVSFLCSLVKGTGRSLFEYIAQDKAADGFEILKIEPANYKLRELYTSWMQDRLLSSRTKLSLYFLYMSLLPVPLKRS